MWNFIKWIYSLFDSEIVKRVRRPPLRLSQNETHQYHQRQAEFQSKQNKVVDAVLGARKNEMYFLRSLATHPDHQGRGYATMLMDAASDLVR